SPPASQTPPGKPRPTPLERHVMFFDRDNDGKIHVSETRSGLQELGTPFGLGWILALAINAGLSRNVMGKVGLTLDVDKIHKGKHPGDTGVYDAKGEYVSERFERVKTFDADKSGALSWKEIKALMAANGGGKGNFAALGEFGLLFYLAKDRQEKDGNKTVGALSLDRLKQLYDGTLFYRLTGRPLPDWAN
ncbi:MAG: EF-hand domain-containing protein, partial [Candidatus Sericytochromatia bacterium]|nr:EF-hand domain-containing protein [Candidatus Tanganyikabacteria bacterium]